MEILDILTDKLTDVISFKLQHDAGYNNATEQIGMFSQHLNEQQVEQLQQLLRMLTLSVASCAERETLKLIIRITLSLLID